MAINAKGVWLGMKFVAPAIVARGGGTIVNTASIAGLRGTPNVIAYTASKHAVVGMTRTASMELIRRGVRVNAICPEPIETPMVAELEASFARRDPRAFRDRMTATIPMHRYGNPEEVAAGRVSAEPGHLVHQRRDLSGRRRRDGLSAARRTAVFCPSCKSEYRKNRSACSSAARTRPRLER